MCVTHNYPYKLCYFHITCYLTGVMTCFSLRTTSDSQVPTRSWRRCRPSWSGPNARRGRCGAGWLMEVAIKFTPDISGKCRDRENPLTTGVNVHPRGTSWWFGTWISFFHMDFHHPNWLIVFRGLQITKQYKWIIPTDPIITWFFFYWGELSH